MDSNDFRDAAQDEVLHERLAGAGPPYDLVQTDHSVISEETERLTLLL
jgi:hypothetical protein